MYFVEKIDGTIEKIDEDLNLEVLGGDVVAAYTVHQKFIRPVGFVATQVTKKNERAYMVPDGSGGMIALKASEMNAEQKAYRSEQMKGVRQKAVEARAAKKAAAAEQAV